MAGTMPRKMVVELPETEAERETGDTETDDAVERAESEAPGRVESRIFRRHPATGNREMFTDTVDSDAVTADYLRQTYGGGLYRIQVVGPVKKGKGGKPGRGILRQLRYEIDTSIPPKHPAQAVTPSAAPVPAPNGASSLDAAVATMLTSMISQQQTAQQQQAESTRAMNLMMMTMMKDHSAMLATQLQALARPAADPLEQAERLTKILQPPKATGFGDFIRDYQSFKELMGDGDGGGNGEHWAAQIAKAVAPHLLRGNAEQPAPAPADSGTVDGPVVGRPVMRADIGQPILREGGPYHVAPETPELPLVPNDLLPLAGLLPKLRSARALGLSPELIAQAILDGTDDDDTLETLLNRPGLVADIHKAAPELPVQWLDDIRRLTRDALRESVEEGEPDDDRGGDGAPAPAGG